MIAQLISFLKSHPDQVQPFADKVGVDYMRVIRIVQEEGKFEFSDLKQIADKLKVSLTQLLSNKSSNINFQFRSAVFNVNQLIVDAKVNAAVDIFHPIIVRYGRNSYIPSKEDYDFPNDPQLAADIVRLALLNNDYGRPLLDLAQLICDKLNVYLIISDIGADGVSAFIDGYAYVIISPRFGPRMLFTLAHELGHLILQHHQNSLQIDFEGMNAFARRVANKYESFANIFASELLMPKSTLGRVLVEFKERNNIPLTHIGDVDIIFLAYYFGVSFEVAAMRCEHLDLLGKGGARSLYERIVKDYKSPEKRAKDIGFERAEEPLFPIKASPNLLRCLFTAIDEGEISASKAATLLGVDIQQLFTFHSNLGDELYS